MTHFSVVFFNWHMFFFGKGYCFFKAHVLPEVNTSNFLDCIHHMNTLEWFIDLDFSSLVINWTIPMDGFRSVLDNAFSQVHNILVVSIGLVDFDGCEFGVVSSIHSFITEDTSNFINALHSTNDQAFQVKFGRNTKDHVNVLGIVVSDKRTRRCSTSLVVKDRSFYFKEALTIQVTTDF